MDLTFSSEQRWLRSAAAEFLAARVESAGVRVVEGCPGGFSASVWWEMVSLGWPGLGVVESCGGAGAGFVESCVVFEELGRWLVPVPLVPSVVCAAGALAGFGCREWLSDVAAGRVWVPVVETVEGVGSGVVSTVSGEGFVLDGSAMFVPYADAADVLLVVADAGDGLTALAVEASSPGVVCERLDVAGVDPLCRVDFRGVRVCGDRVVGAVGGGGAVLDALVEFGAAATCAVMVGGAQRVLDMTVEYAGRRCQFGRPVGSFQSVQNLCADMAVDVLGARLAAYEAIWRLSTGCAAAVEVATAKAWVSEAYQRVCARGHQVHGAIGFTREHDLHLYSRHAAGAAVAFGDGGFHLGRVAAELGL